MIESNNVLRDFNNLKANRVQVVETLVYRDSANRHVGRLVFNGIPRYCSQLILTHIG